jgi:DNA-binding transcriptional MerR regulator
MAYYDEDFIEKLERVRNLKRSGFSLSQIKQLMHEKQGWENELIKQTLTNINRLFPSGNDDSLITRERIRSLGISDENIEELIGLNLVAPVDEEGTTFPSYCYTICEFLKYFLDAGIPMIVARAIVQKIFEVTQLERDAFNIYIRKPLIENNASLDEQNSAIQNCAEKINSLLPLVHLQLLKLPAEKQFQMNSLQIET